MRNILLIPLKIIATIILIPFHLIGSFINSVWFGKGTVIRLRIVYVPGTAFITSESNHGEQNPAHFIVAYLLFISQYFYSCDKRQVAPVAKCLSEHIANSGQPDQLAGALLQTVRATLNAREKDAVDGLLLRYPNRPPLTYIEGEPAGSKMAKYSLSTCKKGDRWFASVHVSWWAILVMFPITVGVLYNYIADKLNDSDKALLDSCITQLLAAQDSSDYRSMSEGASYLTANRVIAENLLEGQESPMATEEDWTLDEMLARGRASKGGRELTATEEAEIKLFYDEIAAAQKDLDDHLAKKELEREQKRLSDLEKLETLKTKRAQLETMEKIVDDFSALIASHSPLIGDCNRLPYPKTKILYAIAWLRDVVAEDQPEGEGDVINYLSYLLTELARNWHDIDPIDKDAVAKLENLDEFPEWAISLQLKYIDENKGGEEAFNATFEVMKDRAASRNKSQ